MCCDLFQTVVVIGFVPAKRTVSENGTGLTTRVEILRGKLDQRIQLRCVSMDSQASEGFIHLFSGTDYLLSPFLDYNFCVSIIQMCIILSSIVTMFAAIVSLMYK